MSDLLCSRSIELRARACGQEERVIHITQFFLLQLMLRTGLIRPTCSGVFHLLPMGLRVLNKLTQLIHSAMAGVGAVQMALPILTPATQWRKTG